MELSVYGVPELSTKARVSNTGDLYLPLIDYIHVGDSTLEEAQALIEKRLSDGGFVRNPHVAMLVDEYASQGVTVLGEVARPGVYPVIGDRRLFDVVSVRNDPDDYARTCAEWLRRLTANHDRSVELVGEERTADYERYLSATVKHFQRRHQGLARIVFVAV